MYQITSNLFNYLYKIAIILGLVMALITVSFFVDFIDVKGYRLENVMVVDLILASIITAKMIFINHNKASKRQRNLW